MPFKIYIAIFIFAIDLVFGYNKFTKFIPPPSFYTQNSGPLQVLYKWKQLDFNFKNDIEREIAILQSSFIPENNLPLGIDIWRDKIFLTVPRWKKGVMSTLNWIPRYSKEESPKLRPYPNLDFNSNSESCESLTSVFRTFVDECDRLWALDSGQIEVLTEPKQICPPSIFVFDLKTNNVILKYEIPEEFVKQDSLHSNIVVDVRGDCSDAYAYATDVWRYGLLVFSLKSRKSWRLTHGYFYPDPLLTRYTYDNNLTYSWNDGIFGLALSPYSKKFEDRILFFHPMSSSREFFVRTSLIRNETFFSETHPDQIKILGESRGEYTQASAEGMDRNGILFFNLVTRNSIACWDSSKPYKKETIGIVQESDVDLLFPNDMKIDREKEQSLWILSNKLPRYLYQSLDQSDYNFRVLTSTVKNAIKDSICDPSLKLFYTYKDLNNYYQCRN